MINTQPRTSYSPAFTLIELLVVITIIGILSSVLILNFVGIRQRQEVSLMADQSVAMLQQARSEIKAGKVLREEADDGTETVSFVCQGAFFEVGEVPLLATGIFDGEEEKCLYQDFGTEFYGLSTGGAYIDEITVGDVDQKSIWVFYAPPEAELRVFAGDHEELLSGDSVVHFNHSTETDLDLSISISSLTNLVTLNFGTNEEE